jgi:hypothetical protein
MAQPVHARSGETLLPAQPLKASAVGIAAPLANALLVTTSFATVPVPGARSVTVGVAAVAGAAGSGILLHTAALATATAARIGNKERINTTSACTVPKRATPAFAAPATVRAQECAQHRERAVAKAGLLLSQARSMRYLFFLQQWELRARGEHLQIGNDKLF